MVYLTIAGDKHSAFEDDGAKVIRRELKQSSFKRSFELGELLDGENIRRYLLKMEFYLLTFLKSNQRKTDKTYCKDWVVFAIHPCKR